MTPSIVLHEDYTNLYFYSYESDANFEPFLVCEDDLAHIRYILGSLKSTGLLLLIDSLLSSSSEPKQKMRNYSLAKKLIQNFYKTSVTITPPKADTVKFIALMVEEANYISSHLKDHQGLVYIYAKRLKKSIDACQFTFDDANNEALQRSWQDFAIHFLNEKLQRLKKNL